MKELFKGRLIVGKPEWECPEVWAFEGARFDSTKRVIRCTVHLYAASDFRLYDVVRFQFDGMYANPNNLEQVIKMMQRDIQTEVAKRVLRGVV